MHKSFVNTPQFHLQGMAGTITFIMHSSTVSHYYNRCLGDLMIKVIKSFTIHPFTVKVLTFKQV